MALKAAYVVGVVNLLSVCLSLSLYRSIRNILAILPRKIAGLERMYSCVIWGGGDGGTHQRAEALIALEVLSRSPTPRHSDDLIVEP